MMTTMTVWMFSAGACGKSWSVQTICAIGIGDNFSNCNSTIASVSPKLLLGSSTTRRKTFSGGSQATFNLGCQSEAHDLATGPDGRAAPGALLNSRLNAPLLASNCQRRFASGAVWRMLQDCQRAMVQLRIADCGLRIENFIGAG